MTERGDEERVKRASGDEGVRVRRWGRGGEMSLLSPQQVKQEQLNPAACELI